MDAGNYSVIENDNASYKVPMRIGIRKSKIKFIDPREYFRIMEAAIAFYESFFSTPFPWSKYDTVFCPEFRIRGMENVGMINMTDKYFKPKNELTEM
jgi:aminopeptidase N